MDRKSFIRNLIGTGAAITIVPMIEPLAIAPILDVRKYPVVPAEALPGMSKQLFKLYIKDGWFRGGDIILRDTANMSTSDASQYYVRGQNGKLIAVDLETGEPKIELVETGPVKPVTVPLGDEGGMFTFHPSPVLDSVYDENGYRYTRLGSALPELSEIPQ